jgi:hypothetical protein
VKRCRWADNWAGRSWGAGIQINDDSKNVVQDWPALVVDPGGNAFEIWKDFRNLDPDIYFSYRPAGGSWSANTRVDDGGSADVDNPDLTIDAKGNLYAVWQDWRYDDPDVYFSFRPAGGNWRPGELVSDDPTDAIQYPAALAIDGAGNAYALWTDARISDTDIYFSEKPSGGAWSPNEQVNDDAGSAEQWSPAIVVDAAGNAYALWQDNRSGNYDVYTSYRPVGGSWGANEQVNHDPGTADQYTVAITVKGNTVVAIWQDLRNGDSDIYSRQRLPGGEWSADERVNDDPDAASQFYPAIAIDPDDGLIAVWTDERNGNLDVYSSSRKGALKTFLPVVRKH